MLCKHYQWTHHAVGVVVAVGVTVTLGVRGEQILPCTPGRFLKYVSRIHSVTTTTATHLKSLIDVYFTGNNIIIS